MAAVPSKINDTHGFLIKYTLVIVSVFAVLLVTMWYAHDKTGTVPLIIGFVFYYLTPVLMWSIPVTFAIVGGCSWRKNIFPDATMATKWLTGFVGGTLYFLVGAVIVFVAYKIGYSRW
jgi:hypothetical protein